MNSRIFPLIGHLISHGSLLMIHGSWGFVQSIMASGFGPRIFVQKGEEAAPFADGSSFCADLKMTRMDFMGHGRPKSAVARANRFYEFQR